MLASDWHGSDGTTCKRFKRPPEDLPADDSTTAGDDEDCHINHICLDILAEVFSLMDYPERSPLRRTCQSWNAAIMSPICRRLIRFDPYYPLQHPDPTFWRNLIRFAFFEDKSNITQYLLFSPSSSFWLGAHGIGFVLHIVSLCGKKVPTLVLANVELDAGYLVNTRDLTLSEPVSAVCDRLVLKNVTLTSLFGDDYPTVYPAFNLQPHAYIPLCAVNTSRTADLISILERIHMDLHGKDLKCLAQWIRHVFREQYRLEHLRHRYHIIQILFTYQRGDSRFDSWKNTEVTKLNLNFKTLRKSTLSVLVEYMKIFLERDYCFHE